MTRTARTAPRIHFARRFYRLPNGKRCQRYVSYAASQFCSKHLPATPLNPVCPTIVQDNAPIDIDLSAELGITSTKFDSDEEIYYFLGRLTYLLSANRIPFRRAAVLAYITSQALRTSCAIQKQFDADQKAKPTEIIMDIAGPKRDPSNPYKLLPRAKSSTETPIDTSAKP